MKILTASRVVVMFLLLIAALGLFFYIRSGNDAQIDLVAVTRGNVLRAVNVTGRVKSSWSVRLGFEEGGRVEAVFAEVGKRVSAGAPLVALSKDELEAQHGEASANLKAARARLAEIRRGARSEEVGIQGVKVENARAALGNARARLLNTLRDAYAKADEAIRKNVDQLFSNGRSAAPELTIFGGGELKAGVEFGRLVAERALLAWVAALSRLGTSLDITPAFIEESTMTIAQIQTFLGNVALIVNDLTPHAALSASQIDGLRAAVSRARELIASAAFGLAESDGEVRLRRLDLEIAERELSLLASGPAPEELLLEEALVEEAAARVELIQSKLAKRVLRSPLRGLVVDQEAKIGQIISPGEGVVAMISEDSFEIETHVPEVDVAKIKVGGTAEVTLDAYGDEALFHATVAAIDPAETIIEGVPTYETTLRFKTADERIKSGMTANIEVLSDRRENVLMIPQRALRDAEGGTAVVRVLLVRDVPAESRARFTASNPARRLSLGRTIYEVEVKPGLRGSDGTVEIMEGLREGDQVVLAED